jgi:hypothetical protein
MEVLLTDFETNVNAIKSESAIPSSSKSVGSDGGDSDDEDDDGNNSE